MTLPDRGAAAEDAEDEVDSRFTLANERTFPAWMRTSPGLLADGVAVHTLVQPFRMTGFRHVPAMSCLGLAVLIALGAYAHRRRVGKAMRQGRPLPDTIMVPVLSVGIAIVSVLAARSGGVAAMSAAGPTGERTALAWRRTAVAAMVVAALLLNHAVTGRWRPAAIAPIGARQPRRHRRDRHGGRRRGYRPRSRPHRPAA